MDWGGIIGSALAGGAEEYIKAYDEEANAAKREGMMRLQAQLKNDERQDERDFRLTMADRQDERESNRQQAIGEREARRQQKQDAWREKQFKWQQEESKANRGFQERLAKMRYEGGGQQPRRFSPKDVMDAGKTIREGYKNFALENVDDEGKLTDGSKAPSVVEWARKTMPVESQIYFGKQQEESPAPDQPAPEQQPLVLQSQAQLNAVVNKITAKSPDDQQKALSLAAQRFDPKSFELIKQTIAVQSNVPKRRKRKSKAEKNPLLMTSLLEKLIGRDVPESGDEMVAP